MQPKYIIGIAIIIVFFIFATMSFQSALTPYVPFSEAIASGKTVQVKGATVEGSAGYDDSQKTFNFTIIDASGKELRVVYNGVKPSNFDEAIEVVAKGRYHQAHFQADELLVKCPSKYEEEEFEGLERTAL